MERVTIKAVVVNNLSWLEIVIMIFVKIELGQILINAITIESEKLLEWFKLFDGKIIA